tara:strand:+ start:384 stop:521 length:138 start_codon:yes stop_codon:yes gene_type:complete
MVQVENFHRDFLEKDLREEYYQHHQQTKNIVRGHHRRLSLQLEQP